MQDKDLKNLLKTGAYELKAELDEEKLTRFFLYSDELKKWNKKINLTSVASDTDIVIRHYLDSLSVYDILVSRQAQKILDIGAGAGFPGIPLGIANPMFKVTLLESIEKKAHFLRHMARMLGLNNVEVINGRAESTEIIKGYSNTFDCVCSRALAGLSEVIGLSLPYAKKGGIIIAIKGPSVVDELKELDIKDIESPELHTVNIPFSNRKTFLVTLNT